jgi:hypothetical protein
MPAKQRQHQLQQHLPPANAAPAATYNIPCLPLPLRLPRHLSSLQLQDQQHCPGCGQLQRLQLLKLQQQ